jgi:hypothetical protein
MVMPVCVLSLCVRVFLCTFSCDIDIVTILAHKAQTSAQANASVVYSEVGYVTLPLSKGSIRLPTLCCEYDAVLYMPECLAHTHSGYYSHAKWRCCV